MPIPGSPVDLLNMPPAVHLLPAVQAMEICLEERPGKSSSDQVIQWLLMNVKRFMEMVTPPVLWAHGKKGELTS